MFDHNSAADRARGRFKPSINGVEILKVV